MKIAYVAAGAAGMYCGSCLHDNTLAKSLMQSGHEVALIPTYTPMRTDEADVSVEPVFYGAVNVYLQQKSTLFQRLPRPLGRLLDRPGLLRWVSRFSASTDASELGALTLSVLRAEHGRQQQELSRLTRFVSEFEPDLIQLTNAMFLGIGSALRRELDVPVVCGLTGEDLFLDAMDEENRERVRQVLVEKAATVDGFIATSRFYGDEMADLLQVPSNRIHVVPLGISLEDFSTAPKSVTEADSVTIGYLARLCPEKGLHLLCEAFSRLKAQPEGHRYRLKIGGYLGPRDETYLNSQLKILQPWIEDGSAEYFGELDRDQKLSLLRGIDILTVPTTYREPKGLFVLEAWAASKPVVQPAHGAFPELIESSGGGLLCKPDSVDDLVAALETLSGDEHRRLELGRRGRRAVEQIYNADAMARRTLAVYDHLIAARASTVASH